MSLLLISIYIISLACSIESLRKDSWAPAPVPKAQLHAKRIGREDESFIQKIQPAAKPQAFKKKSPEQKRQRYNDEDEASLKEILNKPLPAVVQKSEDETYNYIYDLVKDKGSCRLPLREYYIVLAIISLFIFWRTYPVQRTVLFFYRKAVEPTKLNFDKNLLERAV
ncbi:unnamed protein product [Dimorphilus gyrociliatus]|uniref:Uncharacterized protein n=1 Tax=Dimorphilus gyrociliatus TaxID=2664684 RepID=A0A7I8VPZ1_9ANNE|nr:unnamed protein product [Dimorphilus gyrociliatus]